MNAHNPSLYKRESGAALIADSLVKQYKKSGRPALNHFNLQVGQGEFFGLLGTNGAGKTTAVSIFSGFFASRQRYCLGHGHGFSSAIK